MVGFEGIVFRLFCEVSLFGVVYVLMCVYFEVEGFFMLFFKSKLKYYVLQKLLVLFKYFVVIRNMLEFLFIYNYYE